MTQDSRAHHFSTRVIHSALEPDPLTGAVVGPIYATSTYVQSAPGQHKGYVYSRAANPTRASLESSIAKLEGGFAGYAFASGMAAIATVLELLEAGSHVIAARDIYGGTYRLLSGVRSRSAHLQVSLVDPGDPDALEASVRPETRMIWVETPTNPMLRLVDLGLIAQFARAHGLISVCDNTFGTPFIQRPLEHGFDIVVHSTTKYLNGHSDCLGGAAVVREEGELREKLGALQNSTGAILGPFDSFLTLRGIRTLAVRMERHCTNALALAEFLERHPRIRRAHYPGLKSHPQHSLAMTQMKDRFGAVISVEVNGTPAIARQVLQRCRLFSLAEGLGGVESLVGHPASMSHASLPAPMRAALGINDNLIRLSVGIEDPRDLMQDLSEALD